MKNPRNFLAAALPLLLIAVLVFLWGNGTDMEPLSQPESTASVQEMGPPQEAESESSEPDGARPVAGDNDVAARGREIAQHYTLTEKEFQKHIMERHGPDSTDPAKSKFSAEFDVRQGIEDALLDEDSVVKPNTGGRDGYLFEKTYEEPIGMDEKGREVYTIRVVMGEDGFVVTAFPVK